MTSQEISFNDYFMGIALLTASRSKDPNTKVGSVIVSKDNRIISVGWNGMPKLKEGWDNDWVLPWSKQSEDPLQNKYMYVIHSEVNAIIHAKQDVTDCCMYLTWFPCNDCAKCIIQSGIKKIIYLHDDSERYKINMIAAKRLFDCSGVEYKKFSGSVNINFQTGE